jgi:mRNA interferase MazF
LWWAQFDAKRPVLLLSGGAGPQFQVMQIVAPATPAEKRGFVVMSGAQALDADLRRRIIQEAGPARAIGIEVWFGTPEGLAEDGVVRLALPQDGTIFCTWEASLTGDALIERIGVCSPEKLRELDVAMELAGAR